LGPKLKEVDDNLCLRGHVQQEGSPGKLQVRINFYTTILEKSLKVHQKVNIELPDDPKVTILVMNL
jgi:hypothetical protein